ncbi:MAG: MFS transporter [Gemmatimonadetes bacterium]|nr:MFS transporter [Gemmatimonadota bacterium]
MPTHFAEAVIRKVSRRLIPFLFLLYIFAYLDRINIGFAALSMNRELGLTATMFGAANTIFYVGYFLFEIPSNLMLARYGARIWIPRIMITWGIASTATLLATSPTSLYLVRLFVGIAEAGFVPGILLYLTYWFPQSHRARANAVFMVAQPVTIAFGAAISGLILQAGDGLLGMSGWRWLFLIEGLPSIFLGIVAAFYLTSRPKDATWLSDEEKAALERNLAGGEMAPTRRSSWRELVGRNVILLSLAYFGLTMTLNTNATWTPQIVREALAGQSLTLVGVAVAVPALLTAIAMPLWSAHSDRSNERSWHIVLPMALAAAGWLVVALAGVPAARLADLVAVSIGAFAAMAVFWTVPPLVLSAAARPAGIALVSSCGILASATSPLLVGMLRDRTDSFAASLIFVVVVLTTAAALVLLVPARVSAASRVQAA